MRSSSPLVGHRTGDRETWNQRAINLTCLVGATYLVNLYGLSDSLFGFDLCNIKPPYDRLFKPTVIVIQSINMVWPEKKSTQGPPVRFQERKDGNSNEKTQDQQTVNCANRNNNLNNSKTGRSLVSLLGKSERFSFIISLCPLDDIQVNRFPHDVAFL